MKAARVLLPVFAVLTMCAIFWFSAQPAEESTKMSNSVGYLIGELTVPDFEHLEPVKQQAFIDSIDHIIRKNAHAGEYLVLGVLCASSFYVWFADRRRFAGKRAAFLFLMGWGISVLYSVTDEIHQISVPGRACMFTDVLIDASGSAFGILILSLCLYLYHRKHPKQIDRE